MIPATFVATCVVVAVVPGPSFTVIVHQALRHGRGAGLLAVAGNTTALFVWAIGAAFGLTVMVGMSAVAFAALKLLGAGYLCWLGTGALFRGRLAEDARSDGERRCSPARSYRRGLITNLANPKPAALYIAVLPQFLTGGPGLREVFTLASVQMAISTGWYALVTLGALSLRPALSKPRASRLVELASGFLLIGLGIHLVTLTQ